MNEEGPLEQIMLLIFSSLILVLSKIFSVRVKKSSNSHSLPEIS